MMNGNSLVQKNINAGSNHCDTINNFNRNRIQSYTFSLETYTFSHCRDNHDDWDFLSGKSWTPSLYSGGEKNGTLCKFLSNVMTSFACIAMNVRLNVSHYLYFFP